MSRDGKPHQCGWCLLRGHHENNCHVKAEGRREADVYDDIATETFHGMMHQRARSGDYRAKLSKLLRERLS